MAINVPRFTFALTTFLVIIIGAHSQSSPEPCIIELPNDPLTAQGLATPFIIKSNSNQTNSKHQVFAEATVFDPDTKIFGVYHPLVINEGTQPAIMPVMPTLSDNAVVGLWFGASTCSIKLTGHTQGCVKGQSDIDDLGRVAFCNSAAFYSAVHNSAGDIIPPIGNDKMGRPCPTTRYFGVSGQDSSNSIVTTYLQSNKGQFAQDTMANRNSLQQFSKISAGSSNAILSQFLNPALGCTPLQAPSMMEQNVMLTSMALNELQATKQQDPVALVPITYPSVLSSNLPNLSKVNAYRLGVNQPMLDSLDQGSIETYCINFDAIAPKYIKSIKSQIIDSPSPNPSAANNLFTFMAQRYSASWTSLSCDKILNKTSTIAVTRDNGVAVAVQFGNSKSLSSLRKRNEIPSDPEICNAVCTADNGGDIRNGGTVSVPSGDNSTRDTKWGPLSVTDRDLVHKVKLASLWELPMAQEALRLSGSSKVRNISTKIAEQHIFLDSAVISVAKQLGVELPAEPSKIQSCWMCDIRSKSGEDYDLTYVKWLRFAHGQVFAFIGTARGNTQNTLVRSFSETANKIVLGHMQMLESTGLTRDTSFP